MARYDRRVPSLCRALRSRATAGTPGGGGTMTHPVICPTCGSRRAWVTDSYLDYGYTDIGHGDIAPVVRGAWLACECRDCRTVFDIQATSWSVGVQS
ncbi:MAG: hypothetical protein PHQ24_09295 [Proteiniphilum sp.]|nr:hypothetical protein [Proteiniphilum sp.]